MDPTEQENDFNDRKSLLCPDASPYSEWFLTAVHILACPDMRAEANARHHAIRPKVQCAIRGSDALQARQKNRANCEPVTILLSRAPRFGEQHRLIMVAAKQRCAIGKLYPVNADRIAAIFDMAVEDKRDLLPQNDE